MQVEVEQKKDICIVRFHGRMTAGAEVEYLGGKSDEIKKTACAKVLADFREVESVGSTGIGFVVSLYTSVTKQAGGRFVLVGANGRVRETLNLTRLSTILPTAPTFESGLAYLEGRSAAPAV